MSGEPPGSRAAESLSALLRELVAAPEVGDAWEGRLRPGLVVDKFELVREIGRGGFGVVWEAVDLELRRKVAFKAVRSRGASTLREERLLREAETAAMLAHPNIVTLFDAGRTDDGPYLVMELLAGRTLARRLAEGPLPLSEALRIATAVSRGVAHAHAAGVIHRDLKPDNVFLCDDGQVKVLDLGLAHMFGQLRVDGGTPGYMAPEQHEGAPEDERTDVFALGVMLFEMLSGQHLFEGGADMRSRWHAPRLEVPGHAGIGPLVDRMVAWQPVDRPRDGAEVVATLAALEREAAPPPSSGPAVVRRSRRALAAAIVAALAVAGAALAVRRAPAPRPARSSAPTIAVLPFVDLSPQKDQEYLTDGLAEEVLAKLARVPGLRVAGRTSSFYLKGRGEDVRRIGALLGVTRVLEGSVRRSGDQVRVGVQLVSVDDGLQAWSATYDRSMSDLFALQDEIARAVVTGLRPTLLPAMPVDPPGGHTNDPEVHAAILRAGRMGWLGTEEAMRGGLVLLEGAVERDPGYAPAWASLAHMYMVIGDVVPVITRNGRTDNPLAFAKAIVERAIEVGPDVADGYGVRAALRTNQYDWDGALADLEKAQSLGESNRGRRAALLAGLGRTKEAMALAQEELADEPYGGLATLVAQLHLAEGDAASARLVLEQALARTPERVRIFSTLGYVELLAGNPRAALDAAARTNVLGHRWVIEAMAHYSLGNERESVAALERLEGTPEAACQWAQALAWRGEKDRAFEALDRALAVGDAGLRLIKVEVFTRGLRSDPRYAALLAKLKLPQSTD